MFRSPIYLDIETLVPLANYYDIEVMVDVSVSQRDVGRRAGQAGVKFGIPASGGFDAGLSKGSETELTQSEP